MSCRKYHFLFALSTLVVVFQSSWAEPARNVILMIGDGMGPNHLTLYQYYSERILSQETAFSEVMNEGTTGWMLHHPVTGIVTDSAAGATALACGIKVLNGTIALDPEGNVHPTFLEIAKRNGKKTAIVTNIPPFDATESAFTAHVPHRGDYAEIIQWTFQCTKPNILLGSALKDKVDGIVQDDITKMAQENGYTLLTDSKSLSSLKGVPLAYGVFDVKTPYRDNPAPSRRAYVTLSELTRAALDAVKGTPEGFFMMVEGAKIDKVSHPNDAGSVLREMSEFDKSIAVAFDFAKQNPDTLLIITADHETGGLAILGGDEKTLGLLGKQKEALSGVRDRLGDTPTVEEVRKAFSEATGIELTPEEAQFIHTNWKEADRAWGLVLAEHTKVGFQSTSHTATPVVLTGFGPGSERCNGLRDNTDVFDIMMDATGMTR